MRQILCLLCMTVLAVTALSLSVVTAVEIDWVAVGNERNDPDDTGYGRVDYTYWIGKFEVTNAQYAEFLNAVAKEDPHNLYSQYAGSSKQGGIVRTGTSPNYSYAVKANAGSYSYGDKPATFVSYYDCLRFANWLHNGQPKGPQTAQTTEDGAYTFTGSTSVGARNPAARFFLPTEDEWYKAAYYDPDKNGTGGYWDFPTRSDVPPNNNLPAADTGNSANFWDGHYTTGSELYPMTAVGAYELSASAYGTFDQGGNAWEWIDALRDPAGLDTFKRGSASTQGGSTMLKASTRSVNMTTGENGSIGFRVATSIPEPSTLALLSMGAVGVLAWARSRRRSGIRFNC